MIVCAVIGNPIGHSLSPVIHQEFAKQAHLDLCYEKLEGTLENFEKQVIDFFKNGGRGLNVTLTFKERAFRLAASITPRCAEAKAANTLWMAEGVLHADNTDGCGLIKDLAHYLVLQDKNILLLGAGGAARGIIGPLLAASIKNLTLVNRSKDKAENLQKEFPQIHCSSLQSLDFKYDLILNATSASLTNNTLDLPQKLFDNAPFCYDLAYNRENPTPFIAYALAHNCPAVDGLGMLVEQAAEAFFIWHGFKPETSEMLRYPGCRVA